MPGLRPYRPHSPPQIPERRQKGIKPRRHQGHPSGREKRRIHGRVGNPHRLGALAYHNGRKLFVKGFLFGLGPWRIMASGNYEQKVSSPAWGRGVSKRQETMGKKFPLRHGAMAYHGNRKLWAKGFLSGVGPWRIMAAGNYGQKVSCLA